MQPTYGCRDTCINSCPRKCRVPAFSIKQLLSFDPPPNQFTICVLPSRFPGWNLTLSTIPNFRNHLGPWVIPLKLFSLWRGAVKGRNFGAGISEKSSSLHFFSSSMLLILPIGRSFWRHESTSQILPFENPLLTMKHYLRICYLLHLAASLKIPIQHPIILVFIFRDFFWSPSD